MNRIRKVRFHLFGDSGVLQLEEIEQSQPDAGQVLVTWALRARTRSTTRSARSARWMRRQLS